MVTGIAKRGIFVAIAAIVAVAAMLLSRALRLGPTPQANAAVTGFSATSQNTAEINANIVQADGERGDLLPASELGTTSVSTFHEVSLAAPIASDNAQGPVSSQAISAPTTYGNTNAATLQNSSQQSELDVAIAASATLGMYVFFMLWNRVRRAQGRVVQHPS